MQFIDEAKVYLRSGNGGNGCRSFRREKFVANGGPDGGDGGRGGDIIFRCSAKANTLVDFRFKQHFKADAGEHGKGSNRAGKAASDLILEVPLGTQIFTEDNNHLLYDFTVIGEEFKILTGGRGGLGNSHFKSSVNQAPTRTIPGEEGSELWVWIKLKLISDAGLVGMPNAGKSTFLAKVTSAKPKIADYPFTTMTPGLGVVYIDEEEFVLADIPGLIEGAHEGLGLGHRFLKHVERSGVILHLIDGTALEEDIVKNYFVIRHELEQYSEKLKEQTEIVCINKIDALTEEDIAAKTQALEAASGQKVWAISAVTGKNVKELLRALLKIIHKDEEV